MEVYFYLHGETNSIVLSQSSEVQQWLTLDDIRTNTPGSNLSRLEANGGGNEDGSTRSHTSSRVFGISRSSSARLRQARVRREMAEMKLAQVERQQP